MTQDEIIEMARQAGGIDITKNCVGVTVWLGTDRSDFLEAFAKLAVEKEREIWARRVVRLQNLMDLREQQPNKPCCIAEREACAKLLETTDLGGLKDNPEMQSWVAEMLLAYVKAIRARKQA
jgi:hypothetical protein